MGNSERIAKLHPDPCLAWGPTARISAATWEAPVPSQLGSLRLDNATRAQIVAALSPGQRPVGMDRARVEHQMRELALAHAAGGIDDAGYLARMTRLRAQLAEIGTDRSDELPASRAIEWMDALAETWAKTELADEKSDLIHAVYERITVAGPRFVSARLTPAAYAHGMAIALPDAVMARPTGVRRRITTYRIPIEGRDE